VSLEGLAEKVSILGLRRSKRNRCDTAKGQAGRAKSAEASSGESASGETRRPAGGQPHQDPLCTAGTAEPMVTTGPTLNAPGPLSPGVKGQPKGLGKCQRSSGGTLGDWEAQADWAA
jgi:hypothetical protein